MGAGFAIAMRDLEIRGAGNILGTEQSGHIASVGYELYCQLLDNAVRHAEKRARPRAVSRRRRSAGFGVSARLVRPVDAAENRDLSQTVADSNRCRATGGVGGRAARSLRSAAAGSRADLPRCVKLQVFAHHWQIDDIHLEGAGVRGLSLQQSAEDGAIGEALRGQLRVVDALTAYLGLPERELSGDELVAS